MVKLMKRSRKSNRVSWAPGVELCQVKLFLSEDCPSQVANEHRCNLQAKTSGPLCPTAMDTDDLPPGFESGRISKNEPSIVPQISWKCPPKFVMNLNWQVASGEESEEIVNQKLRERRVHEAVYTHPSAIPPSPLVSVDVHSEHYDDNQTAAVPLTPIEDKEAMNGTSKSATKTDIPISQTLSVSKGPLLSGASKLACFQGPLEQFANLESALGKFPGGGADIVAAISAALTTFLKSKEQGTLIDTSLLIKILSDPKMVEQLIHDLRAPPQNISAPTNAASSINYSSRPEIGSPPLPCPKPGVVSSPMPDNSNLSNFSEGMPLMSTTAVFQPGAARVSGSNEVDSSVHIAYKARDRISAPSTIHGNPVQPLLHSSTSEISPLPKSIQTTPSGICTTETKQKTDPMVAATKVDTLKNLDYLKNLIREHGREKNETPDKNISLNGYHLNERQNWKAVHDIKLGEMKKKFDQPCIYFKSSRGCRNGSSCPYLHEMPLEWRTGSVLEAASAKRMRLGGEVMGRWRVENGQNGEYRNL